MFDILFWIVAITLTVVATSALKQFVGFAVRSALGTNNRKPVTITVTHNQ